MHSNSYLNTNRTILFALLIVGVLLAALTISISRSSSLVANSVLAASPTSGIISPSTPNLAYTGGPFMSINQTDTDGATTIVCSPASPCDDFALGISIPSGDTNTYIFTVKVSWTDKPTADSSHNDFDVFVYDSKGNEVTGGSAATSSNPEQVSISVKDANYK